MIDPSSNDNDDAHLPVSARIRARIQQARHRFHANDNIAAFVQPGELDALLDPATYIGLAPAIVQQVVEAFGAK
jgi:adenylosuccinate lyase